MHFDVAYFTEKAFKRYEVKENVREDKAYIPLHLNPFFLAVVYQL